MTTLSLADARADLSELVESAVTTHGRFEVVSIVHRRDAHRRWRPCDAARRGPPSGDTPMGDAVCEVRWASCARLR